MTDDHQQSNQIEQVPAVSGHLYVLQEYGLQPHIETAFETQGRNLADIKIRQPGCLFVRSHKDVEITAQRVSFELWQGRVFLIKALLSLPADAVSESVPQIFLRLAQHMPGSSHNGKAAQVGQIVSLRHFFLKVDTERLFEQLWTASAHHEARQTSCLYKRLYRDLEQPTHYVSYSLWPDRAAPLAAAQEHSHYQSQHTPYPLTSPVLRSTLEVTANLIRKRP
jgi:quinol monooxygenase YgiN